MIWITVNALTVMISVCLHITEMKREIFVLESRNAMKGPRGLENKIARNAFVGSPSFFMQRGQ